jgi:hypothetical protein
VEAGDEPEWPVAFRSGTVPFALQCWTDSALAHYSGTAIYETDFQLPPGTRGQELGLDLGAVGLAAEAWVNGKKVGERAWRPFWFDITKAVREGKNALRIRVANSNAGWQAQGGTIYGKGSWGLNYNTERDRLPALYPNGLEGPVLILLEDRGLWPARRGGIGRGRRRADTPVRSRFHNEMRPCQFPSLTVRGT